MRKVNKLVMEKWVTQKVTELLGFEDEIVIGLVVNTLAESVRRKVAQYLCRCTGG